MHLSLQSLLEKYKHLKNPKDEKIKIAKIVSYILGIEITNDQVEIKKDILNLKIDNYLKTEIFMKKDKILNTLKENKFFFKNLQ
jgi:hypothetical protein